MNIRSKGRGRPGPDASKISKVVQELELALNAEDKLLTNTIVVDQISNEDALSIRDGSARKLRFHKLWFDLPSEVFLTSINLLDRFLTRMKVKPAYISCVSTSCFYIATQLHKCPVTPSELLSKSQAKFNFNDVERMSKIIREKLNLTDEIPVTAHNFLSLYLKVLEQGAKQLSVRSPAVILQKKNILTRLEVVMLDSECARYRPSVIALALLQVEIERFVNACHTNLKPMCSADIIQCFSVLNEIQCIIKVNGARYQSCYSKIKMLLENYDNNIRTRRYRLRLRTSCRMHLRPTINFRSDLNIISE
jgi:cyclin G2